MAKCHGISDVKALYRYTPQVKQQLLVSYLLTSIQEQFRVSPIDKPGIWGSDTVSGLAIKIKHRGEEYYNTSYGRS